MTEQDNNGITKLGCVNHDCDKCKAQPEQEPVAWVCRHKLDLVNGKTSLLCTTDKELADSWLSDYKDGYAWLVPVYDIPPQRTWVGLTDEEVKECMAVTFTETIAKAEAKLKEKNT